MRLTKNLARSEAACKCGCGADTVDFELVKAFQDCCNHFARLLGEDKVVADIHSGYRCKAHNEIIMGSPKSQHLQGRALDFSIRGVSNDDIHAYLLTRHTGRFGIGKYSWGIHLDSRTEQSRW